MKVFVTGGTGFLGYHVVKECVKRKYMITSFTRKENLQKKRSIMSEFENVGVNFRYGDIINFDDVKRALDENYDIVFHLASMPKENSDKNFIVDVIGTKNLFKAIKENRIKIKKFLYMSSAGVYGPQKSDAALDENSVCAPRTNYENSKYKAEQLVQKNCKKYKINYIIIRSPMIYGPRNWQKAFLKYIKLIKMGLLIIFDLPINLVFVKNLVHGIFLSLSVKNETFIISDEKVYSQNEIADMLCFITKPKIVIRICIPKMLIKFISLLTGKFIFIYGINNVKYSIEKAKYKLKYKEIYSLEMGLKKTIAWYKKYINF